MKYECHRFIGENPPCLADCYRQPVSTRGVEVRRTLEQELGLFYDQLLQAVITGDPHWLDLILADWAPARTQSELEQSASSLPPILAEMLLSMYEVCDQSLDSTGRIGGGGGDPAGFHLCV